MLKNIFPVLRELIYPHYCFICHNKIAFSNEQDALCRHCQESIIFNTPAFCQKCGRTLSKISTALICPACTKTQIYFERAWASCPYQGVVKEMIHSFKYKNNFSLGKHLSCLLIDFIQEYHLPITSCDYIIPIPLSLAKLREREFNQAQILGFNLSLSLSIPMQENNLKRIRNTASQTELDHTARWRNIAGAFRVENPNAIDKKTILLIDDVITTGATASEAAKALKYAGANAVFALAIAN